MTDIETKAPDEKELTDIRYVDELDCILTRLRGLRLALLGLENESVADKEAAGAVILLADDIIDRLDECADAFNAGRKLRIPAESVKAAVGVADEGERRSMADLAAELDEWKDRLIALELDIRNLSADFAENLEGSSLSFENTRGQMKRPDRTADHAA